MCGEDGTKIRRKRKTIASMIRASKHDFFYSRMLNRIPIKLLTMTDGEEDNEKITRYYKHRKQSISKIEKRHLNKEKKIKRLSRQSGFLKSRSHGTLHKAGISSYQSGRSMSEIGALRVESKTAVSKGERGNLHSNEPNCNRESNKFIQTAAIKNTVQISERSSIETLRVRLKKKILDLRTRRTAEEEGPRTRRRNVDGSDIDTTELKSRVCMHRGNSVNIICRENAQETVSTNAMSDVKNANSNLGKIRDIHFTTLQILEEKNPKRIAGPGSKVQRIKDLLQRAQAKEERLQKLKLADGRFEEAKIEKWKDTLVQASGETIVQDTSRLKRALKRRETKKKKSAEKWDKVMKAQIYVADAKQVKREQNMRKRGKRKDFSSDEINYEIQSGNAMKRHKHGSVGFEGKSQGGFLNMERSS